MRQPIRPTIRPTVTVIPATVQRHTLTPLAETKKRRVAAYARVSTDSEEQLTSYEAQVDYYTRKIQSNEKWLFAGVYADEGISATSTKKRDGFKKMIADAMAGKIDLIVTKSVSRFARNTVDTLTTVRQLKEKGVEVFFEKENIYTLDSKGELLITIMGSLAQEESRSISENVTWGQRKRMQDGKVSMPYKRFLGYTKGIDGTPAIVEAEAVIIRQIYTMFLDGSTYREIAAHLTAEGVPTPGGKTKWSAFTVQSILKNEKYSGNAILQKKFTVDFLTKKVKENEGEVPQYYIENSHPAIVTPETFDLAQEEIQRRLAIGKQLSSSTIYSCKIVCGDCGGFYGCKVWDSNNKYRREVWQCNRRYNNEKVCKTPHLSEENIKAAFVAAFNRLLADKERYIAEYTAAIAKLTDIADFDEETAQLEMQCAGAAAKAQELVSRNARTAQDQAAFKREYEALVANADEAKAKLEAARRERRERVTRKEKLRRFLALIEKAEPLTAFDAKLWQAAVESLVVRSLADMMLVFRSGTEMPVELPGKHSMP